MGRKGTSRHAQFWSCGGFEYSAAIRAPVDVFVIQQSSSSSPKAIRTFESRVIALTEIRRMVETEMHRSSLSNKCTRGTGSLMSPIPIALMDDPPTPFTIREETGRRLKKSLSSEMWTVAPVSQ